MERNEDSRSIGHVSKIAQPRILNLVPRKKINTSATQIYNWPKSIGKGQEQMELLSENFWASKKWSIH
jgi:hypothetical protein